MNIFSYWHHKLIFYIVHPKKISNNDIYYSSKFIANLEKLVASNLELDFKIFGKQLGEKKYFLKFYVHVWKKNIKSSWKLKKISTAL